MATTYEDLVKQAYSQIGRTGFGTGASQIDKEGFDYWVSQLSSGAITPQQFNQAFGDAVRGVAAQNPESDVFKSNPDLLKIYAPLEPKKGTTGQYGYFNNAPILNASEADRLLGGGISKKVDTVENNELGWMTNSKYVGKISTGAGIFGVDSDKTDIQKFGEIDREIAKYGGVQTKTYYDGENGNYQRTVISVPVYDNDAGSTVLADRDPVELFYRYYGGGGEDSGYATQKFQEYQKTKDALTKAATQLGIDPNQPIDKLFDAVNSNETVKNLYVVSGRTPYWDKDAAAAAGIKTTTGAAGEMNHANVLYRREGDKLVAVKDPEVFTFNDPKRGGFISSMVLPLLTIPPIAAALGAWAFGAGGLLGGQQALGTGITQGAGGITGITPGALGAAGITAPSGFVLAPSIGATVGAGLLDSGIPNIDYNLLQNMPTPDLGLGGQTGITPDASGIGLQTPTVPNLGSMGGGQGLTIPVDGGTMTQMGLIPTGATPSLGNPSSFINNPDVLGQPVIPQGTPSSLNVSDALRAADTISKLTQQQPQQQQQDPGTIRPFGSVDYSGLLSLLATRPGTTGLLGTRFQPQPINIYNLLG